jgi:hypothetical protein
MLRGNPYVFLCARSQLRTMTMHNEARILFRIARFFFVHDTKTGKNVPNEYKMHQMVIKYPKSP